MPVSITVLNKLGPYKYQLVGAPHAREAPAGMWCSFHWSCCLHNVRAHAVFPDDDDNDEDDDEDDEDDEDGDDDGEHPTRTLHAR